MIILATSDWHLGNIRVPAIDIIKNLDKYLIPELINNKINLLLIAGDIFDQALSLNDKQSLLIISFFIKLFKLCDKYNISVRILKGTDKHDRNQCKVIETIYLNYGFKCNFRYIDKIYLEYIKEFNKTFLYIPDDLQYKNKQEVLSYIHDLLKKHNLKSVNYLVCHGLFDFSLPKLALKKNDIVFTCDNFNLIVKECGFLGLVHFSYSIDKFFYCNSFDRLRHNESGPKGFLIYNNKKITFIENKEATKFITVDVKNNNDLDSILNIINLTIKFKIDNINKRFFIRIKDCPNKFIYAIQSYYYDKYRTIRLSFFNTKDNNINNKLTMTNIDNQERITKKNLPMVIYKNIDEQNLLSVNEIKDILEYLAGEL